MDVTVRDYHAIAKDSETGTVKSPIFTTPKGVGPVRASRILAIIVITSILLSELGAPGLSTSNSLVPSRKILNSPKSSSPILPASQSSPGNSKVPVHASANPPRQAPSRSTISADIPGPVIQPVQPMTPADPVGGAWFPVGPTAIASCGVTGDICSGRVSVITPDPSHPGTIYLGGAQGGVWKTTNRGLNWTALTDNQPSLAIGSIAVDLTGVIYAGTGEANASCDSYYGAGILKSVNGGKTWVQLGASTFGRSAISQIVVNPLNPKIVIASTTWGITTSSTEACSFVPPGVPLGIYVSKDAGASWTRTHTNTTGLGATDLVMDPANPTVVYAASDGNVWRSLNNGTTWAVTLSGTSNVGRIRLAISPSSHLTVFAVASVNVNGVIHAELWRTLNGGNSWSQITTTPNNFCSSQCWYDLYIAVDPTASSTLYLGGLDVHRSTDSGTTWTDLGGGSGVNMFIHTDQHAFAFDPSSHTTIFVGNDGGIWSSTNGNTCTPSSCWTDLNSGLALGQFQAVSASPADSNLWMGGTQDNGTPFHNGTSTAWTRIVGCDGGWSSFDPSTPLTVYTTCNGGPERSDNGGVTSSFIENGIVLSDPGTFYAPMAMDPSTPTTLYLLTYRLYKTTNRGDLWTIPSPGLSLPASDCTNFGICLSWVTVAPSNGSYVYVGTTNGRFFISKDGGSSFVENSVGLPSRFITEIGVDPSNPQRVFVTFTGFGGKHVFFTTNSGLTWTDATSNLPDLPTNAIALNSTTVFVGTDQGVYVSTNSSTTWTAYGAGLPRSAVFDLAFTATGSLLAATHGRSVWECCAATSVGGISVSRTTAYSGVISKPVQVSVNATNLLSYPQTLWVAVLANSTVIGNTTITLALGGTLTVSLNWNASLWPRGQYMLSAKTQSVPGQAIYNGNQIVGPFFSVRFKGDINNDCSVDVIDLALIGAAFGSTPGSPNWNVNADLNNDGVIDITDLTIVGSNFGQKCPPTP